MTFENYMKFKLQCRHVMFYWKTAMSIYLYIVYSCFQTTIAASSNCNRDYRAPQAPNIYYVALDRKSLPETPLT